MEHSVTKGPCALTCWVMGFLAAAVAVLVLKATFGFLLLLVIAPVVGWAATMLLCKLFCGGADAPAAEMTAAAPAGGGAIGGMPAPLAVPPQTEAKTADPAPDFDGDGVEDGTGEGSPPATLSEARDGKGDNLKEIKGVGAKLEVMLNEMGFYHFDQIAGWTTAEVAWVDANLKGFKGRVSRDNWVAQAKILAAGGETEFSKRVDDGDVY